MAYINKSKTYESFTILPNRIFSDVKLSLKATGILAYLLSKPMDWVVKAKDVENRFTDGRDSVYTGIRELEKAGYIKKVQGQENKGKFTEVVYYVYDKPLTGKPLTAKPYTENPQHSNTDISNTNKKYIYRGPKVLSEPAFKGELSSMFNLNPVVVQRELDKMSDYLKSTGKVYKDYKAYARNWIRRNLEKEGVLGEVEKPRKYME